MNQQMPHPGYAITLKDIYHEAMAIIREDYGTVITDMEPEMLSARIKDALTVAQEVAAACGDPRNFTLSIANQKLQMALCEAISMLESATQPKSDDDLVLYEQQVKEFIARVTEEFHIRRVSPEEAEAIKKDHSNMEANLAGIDTAGEEYANIAPFGGN